jgi:hypothetical protein
MRCAKRAIGPPIPPAAYPRHRGRLRHGAVRQPHHQEGPPRRQQPLRPATLRNLTVTRPNAGVGQPGAVLPVKPPAASGRGPKTGAGRSWRPGRSRSSWAGCRSGRPGRAHRARGRGSRGRSSRRRRAARPVSAEIRKRSAQARQAAASPASRGRNWATSSLPVKLLAFDEWCRGARRPQGSPPGSQSAGGCDPAGLMTGVSRPYLTAASHKTSYRYIHAEDDKPDKTR